MLNRLVSLVMGLAVCFASTAAFANWEYTNASQGDKNFHIMWTRLDRADGFQVQCINGQRPEFVFTVTSDGDASDVDKFNNTNASIGLVFDETNNIELTAKARLESGRLYITGGASGDVIEQIASAKNEFRVQIIIDGRSVSAFYAGTAGSRAASNKLKPHCTLD